MQALVGVCSAPQSFAALLSLHLMVWAELTKATALRVQHIPVTGWSNQEEGDVQKWSAAQFPVAPGHKRRTKDQQINVDSSESSSQIYLSKYSRSVLCINLWGGRHWTRTIRWIKAPKSERKRNIHNFFGSSRPFFFPPLFARPPSPCSLHSSCSHPLHTRILTAINTTTTRETIEVACTHCKHTHTQRKQSKPMSTVAYCASRANTHFHGHYSPWKQASAFAHTCDVDVFPAQWLP